MGTVGRYLQARLAKKLSDERVVVWYDADRTWEPWVESVADRDIPDTSELETVEVAGRTVHLARFAGSYTELLEITEAVAAGTEIEDLLVYLPGERYEEDLSPLRELECVGGSTEAYQPDLSRYARQAFTDAGLAEAAIDELLDAKISFTHLDGVVVGGGEEASPLSPVFGSGREEDVIPRYLTDPQSRAQAEDRELTRHVRELVERAFGVSLEAESPDKLAGEVARVLLVAELRSDLEGQEPTEISQISRVESEAGVRQVKSICRSLRSLHPMEYISLAETVEEDLGLGRAAVGPLKLGCIDTFSFEERALLERCAELLAEGDVPAATPLVSERASSFWTSWERFPQRAMEWQLLGELAELAKADARLRGEIEEGPRKPKGWIDAYTAPEGWHRADRLFRSVHQRLTRLGHSPRLESAALKVLGGHDQLVDQMGRDFIESLEKAKWEIGGVARQRAIFDAKVRPQSGKTAVIMADALRFEMGAELARLLEQSGGEAVQLTPAVAEAPTVTAVGMVALLPGAERSFEVVRDADHLRGAIGGRPLQTVRDRMDHAKGGYPGLVEMTLDTLVYDATPSQLAPLIADTPVVVVRSFEIDAAGENLPSGFARRTMGSVLEDIRKGVLRLAEAGVERFLVVADHGHLFSFRREDDMKIDSPSGGETVELHRRCWVGRGANTPPGCVRVPLRELGYQSDLDLVVPRGNGIFKAPGAGTAYHHGGLSLQELVIPVLTFEMRQAEERDVGSDLGLRCTTDKIPNRIFSVVVWRTELPLEPLAIRVLAVDQEGRVVGRAQYAEQGWDPETGTVTLESEDQVSVGIQLEDDTVDEIRVVAVEVGTDRTLKDTQPLPVKLLSYDA